MGSLTSKETAFLVDGLAHVAVALIAAIIGAVIGLFGLSTGYQVDYEAGKRKRHRAIFWTIGLGAAAFSISMFFMVEDIGFFMRSDGAKTEWAGWVGRLILAVFVMWALMESVFMTLQNSFTLVIVVVLSYLGAVLANFLTTGNQYAITLTAWAFFWLLGGILSLVWTNVRRTRIGLAYWAIIWIYLFAGLQGLWLILSDNVSNMAGFNNEVEAWILCGTDILYTAGAMILLGLSYFGNKPGRDSPVYDEYITKKEEDVEGGKVVDPTSTSQMPAPVYSGYGTANKRT